METTNQDTTQQTQLDQPTETAQVAEPVQTPAEQNPIIKEEPQCSQKPENEVEEGKVEMSSAKYENEDAFDPVEAMKHLCKRAGLTCSDEG